MHCISILSTVLSLTAVTTVNAARKANEFVSGNCAQGTASYEHHGNHNVDVTMDDTSNSVYFGDGPWFYYSGKTKNGGSCTGQMIGSWDNDHKHPCVNLNWRSDQDTRRIKCVRWNNSS
ncbi:small secreted protein [Fusarium heterosporum]|uniref:Small secreted protein n=1 Tax=Fusarium heterosporum TaxID=42747 RepID=A0A8H5WSE0_FUSHE|nr:small secreted protein [Fusarium heterosporum]